MLLGLFSLPCHGHLPSSCASCAPLHKVMGEEHAVWHKRKRSRTGYLKDKERRAVNRRLKKRAECSPEKKEKAAERSRLQATLKEAARASTATGTSTAAAATSTAATATATSTAASSAALQGLGVFFSAQQEPPESDSEASACEELPTPSCTPDVPVTHNELHLKEVWTDAHVDLVFKNCIAFPEGDESFVDSFSAENRKHHVSEVAENDCLHAINPQGDEIYACEGRGSCAEGIDPKELYSHLQHLPDVAMTNMATGDYRGVNGYGFVGGVGSRYLYTAKAKYKQKKVGPWAVQDGKEAMAKNITSWIQKGGNATVRRIEKWGRMYKGELQLQRALMDLVCAHSGTATFTFPSAQVGINGGYGVHKDKRDCRRTVWLITGTGALVFPQYEHILYLHPGDLLIFNGQGEWHANMVNPVAEQRRQIVQRKVDALPSNLPQLLPTIPEGLSLEDCWIPQLDGDWDVAAGRRKDTARARQELRDQGLPNYMAQQIVCYYFQRQQRSYFVKTYNQRNPSHPIEVEDYEYSDESAGSDDTSVHGSRCTDDNENESTLRQSQEYMSGLSQYELERLERIKEHQRVLQSLGLRDVRF